MEKYRFDIKHILEENKSIISLDYKLALKNIYWTEVNNYISSNTARLTDTSILYVAQKENRLRRTR